MVWKVSLLFVLLHNGLDGSLEVDLTALNGTNQLLRGEVPYAFVSYRSLGKHLVVLGAELH
jgi:hypothetical protein